MGELVGVRLATRRDVIGIAPEVRDWIVSLLLVGVVVVWYLITFNFTAGWIFLLLVGFGLMGSFALYEVWRPLRAGAVMPVFPGFRVERVGDDVLLGLLVGFAFVVLSAGGAGATVPLPSFAQAGPLPLDQRFIAVVLIAPVVEEVFFRGFVFSLIANIGVRHMGLSVSNWEIFAAVGSGVVFGLYHFLAYGTGLVVALMIVGLFGVVVALANSRGGRVGEGSLWAGLVAHVVYNGVQYGRSVGFVVA